MVHPTVPGTYDHASLRRGHFAMRGRIVVDERRRTRRGSRPSPRSPRRRHDRSATPPPAPACSRCLGCHGTQGEATNSSTYQPAGLNDCAIRRQVHNFQQRARRRSEHDPTGADGPDVRHRGRPCDSRKRHRLHGTLFDAPAPSTVIGDAERGADLFQTCAVCHGRR